MKYRKGCYISLASGNDAFITTLVVCRLTLAQLENQTLASVGSRIAGRELDFSHLLPHFLPHLFSMSSPFLPHVPRVSMFGVERAVYQCTMCGVFTVSAGVGVSLAENGSTYCCQAPS